MIHRTKIPSVNLWTATEGIDALLGAIAPFWSGSASLTLDFSYCTFISAEAVAVLTALKFERDRQGLESRIEWATMSDAVLKQFGRWRVCSVFGGNNHPWIDNAVPLLHQPQRDPKVLVEYVERWVVNGAGMPSMTAELAKETRKSFCELFSNVFRHSESRIGGIAIGQLYPNVKKFQICVCDAGVGLVNRVQGAGYGLDCPTQAIRWALECGNSTWRGGEPPGLGLYLFREFVKVNGGVFRIYANDGCYCEIGGVAADRQMAAALPGTLIELRLNVRDDVTYGLK